jgi:hypothetical protein
MGDCPEQADAMHYVPYVFQTLSDAKRRTPSASAWFF